jgi:hypothetical protein
MAPGAFEKLPGPLGAVNHKNIPEFIEISAS